MFQLASRVQGVDVDDAQTGSQDSEECDRILQHVGQHDRHPIALVQTGYLLEVRGKVPALLIQLAIGHRMSHAFIGGQVAVFLETGFYQIL